MGAITIINGLLPLLSNIVGLIQSVRKTALKNKEMTAEEDAELDAKLQVIFQKAHWKKE